jgi:elongation factor 1-beta
MGSIMSVYKVYPKEVEDVDKIKVKLEVGLEEPFKVAEIKEEPIAFGLKILKVAIIFPDKVDGLLDKLEFLLKEIPGVSELEIEATTLI